MSTQLPPVQAGYAPPNANKLAGLPGEGDLFCRFKEARYENRTQC